MGADMQQPSHELVKAQGQCQPFAAAGTRGKAPRLSLRVKQKTPLFTTGVFLRTNFFLGVFGHQAKPVVATGRERAKPCRQSPRPCRRAKDQQRRLPRHARPDGRLPLVFPFFYRPFAPVHGLYRRNGRDECVCDCDDLWIDHVYESHTPVTRWRSPSGAVGHHRCVSLRLSMSLRGLCQKAAKDFSPSRLLT